MGGTTYEEALAVHQLAGETNARILLGASTVHNSQRYAPSHSLHHHRRQVVLTPTRACASSSS
jgi:hypothetical protein